MLTNKQLHHRLGDTWRVVQQSLRLLSIVVAVLICVGCHSSDDTVNVPDVEPAFLITLDMAVPPGSFTLPQIENMCIEFWAHDTEDDPVSANASDTGKGDIVVARQLVSRENGCVLVRDHIREAIIDNRSFLSLALSKEALTSEGETLEGNNLAFTLLLFDDVAVNEPTFIGINRDRETVAPESSTKIVMTLDRAKIVSIDDRTVDEREDLIIGELPDQPLVLRFTTADLTLARNRAIGGSSCDPMTNTDYVTARSGDTSVPLPIAVRICNDSMMENPEVFLVNVALDLTRAENRHVYFADGMNAGTLRQIRVTIIDDGPSLILSNVSVLESAGMASVTARLSSPAPEDLSIEFTTQDVTAVGTVDDPALPGADYIITTGTLTFPAGELDPIDGPINVVIVNDLIQELPRIETFVVEPVVVAPVNSSIPFTGGTVTIEDDDMGRIVVRPMPAIALEGDDPTRDLTLMVEFMTPPTEPVTVTVDYETQDHTEGVHPAIGGEDCMSAADPPVDYKTTRGTLTLTMDKPTQMIPLTLCGDMTLEPDETFLVTLTVRTPQSPNDPIQSLTVGVLNDDTEVFAKGVGLNNVRSGDIVLNLPIPSDTPIKAFLTLQHKKQQQQECVNDKIAFDNNVSDPNSEPLMGVRSADINSCCFLADITDRIVLGSNTYTVTVLVDDDTVPINNDEMYLGAGIVVVPHVVGAPEVFDLGPVEPGQLKTIFRSQVGSKSVPLGIVEVKAGCNYFHHGHSREYSQRVTLDFPASNMDRQLQMIAFVGDAQSTTINCPADPSMCRGNQILFIAGDLPSPPLVDGNGNPINGVTILGESSEGLVAEDGAFWDTFGRNSGVPGPNDRDLRGTRPIPAETITSASLQLRSPPPTGVSAALSMTVFELLEVPLLQLPAP